MSFCDKLPPHPFKNAPGVSQRNRILTALNPGSVQIDGATLADRLLFVAEFARQVNFYQYNVERQAIEVENWQRFFAYSPPFVLARLAKTDADALTLDLERISAAVDSLPEPENLRLLRDFVFADLFCVLNDSFDMLHGQPNALTLLWDNAIRTQLGGPLGELVEQSKRFSYATGFSLPDFQKFTLSDPWGLDIQHLYTPLPLPHGTVIPADAAFCREVAKHFRQQGLAALLVLRQIASEAAAFLPDSLSPLEEAYRQQQPPHLGLLFAFLQMFELFRDDLNGLSRTHLEYFFETVLHLSPRKARPDAAHLVLEVQKNLDRYLVKKGVAVKDGKDDHGAEVAFLLDNEIVVDKAQVEQVLTLYKNTDETIQSLGFGTQSAVISEGLYIAPKANSADGQGEAFPEGPTPNWPTLGSKVSKFIPKNKTVAKNHTPARMGFVLASPVLFLQEGKRKVTFTVTCKLNPAIITLSNGTTFVPPEFTKIFTEIKARIGSIFYVISEEALKNSIKDGLSPASAQVVEGWLAQRNPYTTWSDQEPCPEEATGCGDKTTSDNSVCENKHWKTAETLINTLPPADIPILQKHSRRTIFRLTFSGEKEWIPVNLDDPNNYSVSIPEPNLNDNFTLNIVASLTPDQPGVTFFNKENLKEELGTDLPVAKFELDPDIKIWCPNAHEILNCCLENCNTAPGVYVSPWHLFGNSLIQSADIKVEVCGVRNLVVQNDENLQDVNSPIYPFGTRPEVPDFNVVDKLTGGNMNGPNFFIGSREIFSKNWQKVSVNLNWKEKPSDFQEYYKAYVKWPVTYPAEDTNPAFTRKYGLLEDKFKMAVAMLSEGDWKGDSANNRLLFKNEASTLPVCSNSPSSDRMLTLDRGNFTNVRYKKDLIKEPLNALNVNTRDRFLRLSLKDQDFLHKDYPFVLARQTIAKSKLPGDIHVDAVYFITGTNTVISFGDIAALFTIKQKIDDLNTSITTTGGFAQDAKTAADNATVDPDLTDAIDDTVVTPGEIGDIQQKTGVVVSAFDNPLSPPAPPAAAPLPPSGLKAQSSKLKQDYEDIEQALSIFDPFTGKIKNPPEVPIPNEPWTPAINYLSLDYWAFANSKNDDVSFLHLHPYPDTYKTEFFDNAPTLVATPPQLEVPKTDPKDPTELQKYSPAEGTLYLGFKNLTPGSNLNLLFQLAEATADTEAEKALVKWHYLSNNEWRDLREGFEVLEDATKGLTTSGIVKIAVPPDITNGPENTILPRGLHWLKVAALASTRAVCQTIGIHTQAVRATFDQSPANDPGRSGKPLEAGKLAKLREADASVKQVQQPYESFGGRAAEDAGGAKDAFYRRVAERLRHKGRAIAPFDYERLVLEAFPEIYKVKCISHAMALGASKYERDLEWAAGFVTLVVIPDLNLLKTGENLSPQASISLLERIQMEVGQRATPFARIRVFNPRYEGVRVNIKVALNKGYDQNYYENQLKLDIVHFLAPWHLGDSEKLRFGQPIYRSDLLKYVEQLPYVNYVTDLKMAHEQDTVGWGNGGDSIVEPQTARSILTAGTVTVCPGDKPVCPAYDTESHCRPENRDGDATPTVNNNNILV